MKLIVKLAFKNIRIKRFQVILIAITFFLTTVLTLSTIMFKDSALLTKENQIRNNTLNSQIKIISKDNKNVYFSADILAKLKNVNDISVLTPHLSGNADLNQYNDKCTLIGTDFNTQDQAYKFPLLNFESNFSNKTDTIIISENFSKKYNLSLGNQLTLNSEKTSQKFTIRGISENKGAFSESNLMMISVLEAQKLFGHRNELSSIGVTIKNLNDIDSINKNISNALPSSLKSEKQYDMNDFESSVDTINIALTAFMLFSLFVSFYLCYSVYKTFIFEKTKQFGCLRSIGLTRKGMFLLQYFEYFLITLPSVFLGTLVAQVAVKITVKSLSHSSESILPNNLATVIIPILILLAGAISFLYHIYKNSKAGIVGQIKGFDYHYQVNNKYSYYTIFGLLLTFAIFFYLEYNSNQNLCYLTISMISFIFAFLIIGQMIVAFIIKVTKLIASLFSKKLESFFGNFLHEIHSLDDSIILVILVIGICTVSAMVSQIVMQSSINVYNGTDILMNNLNPSTNSEVLHKIQSINEVKETIDIPRSECKIGDDTIIISGINPDKYSKISFESYCNSSKDEMLNKLKGNEKGIIITQGFAKRHNLIAKDELLLKTINGNVSYTIIGIVNSFENMGKVFFVNQENFKSDFVPSYISNFVITKNNLFIGAIKTKIQNQIGNSTYYNINTIDDLQEQNKIDNNFVFSIVNIMIALTLFISTVCLINNVAINAIKRKKAFAIKRTLGMSTTALQRDLLGEGIMIGLICGVLGLVFGIALNIYVVRILSYFTGNLNNVSVTPPYILILLSVIIGVISSISPCKLMKKMNITNIIKGGE